MIDLLTPSHALGFLLIPVVILCVLAVLYKQVGKWQFFSLDLILSIEALVVFPIVFLWSKQLLSVLIGGKPWYLLIEYGLILILLFLHALIIVHLFTKSLSLYHYTRSKKHIITISEYFHHKITHSGIYGGAVLLCTFFSLVNLTSPILVHYEQRFLWLTLLLGIVSGVASCQTVYNYQGRGASRFHWALLILGASSLFLQMIGYMLVKPTWEWSYALYWTTLFGCTTYTLCLALQKLRTRQRE